MVARSDFAEKKNKSGSVGGCFVPCSRCGSSEITSCTKPDPQPFFKDYKQAFVTCGVCGKVEKFRFRSYSFEEDDVKITRVWNYWQEKDKESDRKKVEHIVDCIPNKEQIEKFLKELFPDGHEDFIPTCVDAIELHSKKNKAYAQGGNKLGNFERRADFYSHYPGLDLSKPEVVAIVDAMKQLDAALWMLANKYEDEKENIDARLGDCFVYLGIARILHKEGKEKNKC